MRTAQWCRRRIGGGGGPARPTGGRRRRHKPWRLQNWPGAAAAEPSKAPGGVARFPLLCVTRQQGTAAGCAPQCRAAWGWGGEREREGGRRGGGGDATAQTHPSGGGFREEFVWCQAAGDHGVNAQPKRGRSAIGRTRPASGFAAQQGTARGLRRRWRLGAGRALRQSPCTAHKPRQKAARGADSRSTRSCAGHDPANEREQSNFARNTSPTPHCCAAARCAQLAAPWVSRSSSGLSRSAIRRSAASSTTARCVGGAPPPPPEPHRRQPLAPCCRAAGSAVDAACPFPLCVCVHVCVCWSQQLACCAELSWLPAAHRTRQRSGLQQRPRLTQRVWVQQQTSARRRSAVSCPSWRCPREPGRR